MKRLIAVWLIPWILFALPVSAQAEPISDSAPDAESEIFAHPEDVAENESVMFIVKPAGGGGSSLQCNANVPYAKYLVHPVDRDWQPDPTEYKLITLTEENCGYMTDNRGHRVLVRLGKNETLAIKKYDSGGYAAFVCRNPYEPLTPVIGKTFQCPTCQQAAVAPPGLTRADLEEFFSRLEREKKQDRQIVLIERRGPNPWVVGGIVVVVVVVVVLALGSHSDHGGCPTCPPRTKPNP